MLKLNQLPLTVKRKSKRPGRGEGSGRGKTAGRGTKGQRARGKIPAGFEGGQLPLTKRLPLFRGRGRNRSYHAKTLVINLKYLSHLPKNSQVTPELLVKYHLIKADQVRLPIKVLGEGELTIPLTICLPISKSARKKIEAVGGQIKLTKNQPLS